MSTKNSTYEYAYTTNDSGHHHQYLLPTLLSLLSEIKQEKNYKLRVLDIGCGNGSLSNLLAKQGYEVVGIEDSISGIAAATKSFPECKFINASVYDIPYAKLEGEFDVVISTEVIEHLMYPRELVKSAKRCLKPNGRLILTTPYHGYIKNLILALTGKMDNHFTALWDGGHVKFFSVKTLSQILTEEDFRSLKFTFVGRFSYLWKSMIVSAKLGD
ncbi:class I SAM-dependent methyltransferase [Pseudanabaena sp. FACHB-1998]|uniref:class I SAM-dependent methyltransferase n=1 Tax=Pseudanabaena sp. FACHB-1998 TaxID=2692858 RepID=UPI00168163E8|nr:class I SAM-dependent methyltransferase [Pseudanabaena sp. FACHB-1998]MBD2175908.1 class I SAM-dependent methyltransferase [Pseudanabaena sp. FACHB-1998]